jgi:HEAT repeat protein
MTRSRLLRLSGAVLVLAALAVLVPGSPAYLPDLLRGEEGFQGHGVAYWTAALDGPDAEGRGRAAFALGTFGPGAGEAVPRLAVRLREDPDPSVRHQAALALVKLAPASRAAVPALAEALDDENPFVRMNAALALFRLREEARPAIPALRHAARYPKNQTDLGTFTFSIQEIATLALGRASAGRPDAVPALTAALNEADTERMKVIVLRALGDVGAAARPAVPQVRDRLHDRREVRTAAAEALRQITGESPKE